MSTSQRVTHVKINFPREVLSPLVSRREISGGVQALCFRKAKLHPLDPFLAITLALFPLFDFTFSFFAFVF